MSWFLIRDHNTLPYGNYLEASDLSTLNHQNPSVFAFLSQWANVNLSSLPDLALIEKVDDFPSWLEIGVVVVGSLWKSYIGTDKQKLEPEEPVAYFSGMHSTNAGLRQGVMAYNVRYHVAMSTINVNLSLNVPHKILQNGPHNRNLLFVVDGRRYYIPRPLGGSKR